MNLELALPEIKTDPFADIAKSLGQAGAIEAVVDELMTPELPREVLLKLADTKAMLMRQEANLRLDWDWQLSQTYPATN